MGFNAEAFQSAEFTALTDSVVLPQLSEFFGEGESPTFVVRGLTANELCRAIEAGSKQSSIDTVVKAISSQKDQVTQIRKALGMSADVPGEIAKRMEMIVLGCVSPTLNHASVAKLAEVCPVEFYDLTNKITQMTGKGSCRVKPHPSSQMTQD